MPRAAGIGETLRVSGSSGKDRGAEQVVGLEGQAPVTNTTQAAIARARRAQAAALRAQADAIDAEADAIEQSSTSDEPIPLERAVEPLVRVGDWRWTKTKSGERAREPDTREHAVERALRTVRRARLRNELRLEGPVHARLVRPSEFARWIATRGAAPTTDANDTTDDEERMAAADDARIAARLTRKAGRSR
jgi:hypothetical protein